MAVWRRRRGAEATGEGEMIIQHNMTMIKVDKSEGGFLGSSKPRGGGDEPVTAKLTKQVLTMNDHKPREMDVY